MAHTSKTFVAVHGAWHGGWCWRRMAEALRAHGHTVTTPTLTGLGERAHLLTHDVDLETCIEDVEQHIRFEDLKDVVLVGHSFAGAVVTGVADRMAGRIGRLIYLDALVLGDGESAMSQVPQATAEERLALARQTSGGLTMPAPPASAFGIVDAEQSAWVEARLTPHPVKTYLAPLHLRGSGGSNLPTSYVVCTNPAYPALRSARERAGQWGWPIHELAAGHDAMLIAPAATAELVERIAAG